MADTYGANVSLLLHCNGTNGGTTFTDTSQAVHTVTPYGNTSISTAQSKFGGASAYFDGTGDYLTLGDSTDYDFGTGDFTIEGWVNTSVTGADQTFYSQRATDQSTGNVGLALSSAYGFSVITGTTYTLFRRGTVPLNTWFHFAVTRSGTNLRVFINGTQGGATGTSSDNITHDSGGSFPRLGDANGSSFAGYIDDFRITKGVARYTSNFTAPTAAFDDPPAPVHHSITGSTPITVTSHFTVQRIWSHLLTGSSLVRVVPYSTKVYVQHSHFITGNIKITVLPAATLAHHATTNSLIAGSTTINVTPASSKLWHTPNHHLTGAVQINVTPTTSTWTRAQYQVGNAALVTPSLFAYATGWKEEPNAAVLVLPSLIGAGVGGGLANGALPSLLITATGTQELHGTAEAILPTLYAEATGQREYNGDAALVIPGFNASSFGAATAELILPGFMVSGTGTQEFGGQANCILPGLILAATGQREYNGTAELVLPGFRGGDIGRAALVIQGLTVSAAGSVSFANSFGYILNIHSSESVQWTNMPFLHIVRIGTDYYGVKETGLYRLSTAYTTDSGTAIDATIKTKETDFGDFKSKRLQYAYLASDTSTTIQPIVDGITKQSHASSFGGRKTKMALGNHGRYWQLKISGIQELTGLELLPAELQRRVK